MLNASPTTPLEALNIRGHSRTVPTSAPAELNHLQFPDLFNTRTPVGPETAYARTIFDEDLASIGTEATSASKVSFEPLPIGIATTWAGLGETYASTMATVPTSIGSRQTSDPYTDPTSIGTETMSASTELTSFDVEATSFATTSNRSKILRVTSPSSTSRKYDEPWIGMCDVTSSRNLTVINDSETHIGVPFPNAVNETYAPERRPDTPRPPNTGDQRTPPSRKMRKLLRHILTRNVAEAPGENKKPPITACSAAKEISRVHVPRMFDLAESTGERFGWRLDDEKSSVIQELYRDTSASRKAKASSLMRQLALAESILLRRAKWDSLFRLLSFGMDVRYLDLADPLRALKRPWTCTCGAKRELYLESQDFLKSLAARLLEVRIQNEVFRHVR